MTGKLIDILNITDKTPNPLHMKSLAERTSIIESAISLIIDGITSGNSTKRKEAISAIDDSFSWKDLEVCKAEWDELVESQKKYK